MTKVTATWSISLDCQCPACGEDVNLTDGADFWDRPVKLEAGEHGTPRTDALPVHCPECLHEFEVCCTY